MAKQKDLTLYHRNKNVKTIKQFLEREVIYEITPEDFFAKNKKLIFSQMSDSDKALNLTKAGNWPKSSDDLTIECILPCPCYFKISATKVSSKTAVSQTNFQTFNNDFYAFANEKIQDLYEDEGFRIAESNKIHPTIQVFGWFKTLHFYNQKVHPKANNSSFVDLSNHIISLSTSVTVNGGNFNIRLPIIKINEGKATEGYGLMSKNASSLRHNTGYYAKSDISDIESNYYNWLISTNDLLFISFEKLQMEIDNGDYLDLRDENSLNIEENDISKGIYDMIALVDTVSVVHNANDASGYVEITGRDLMKLVIEDGSFYFNFSTTQGGNVFANEETVSNFQSGDVLSVGGIDNKYTNPLNRLRNVSNNVNLFTDNQNKDIDFIIKGVISKLANIQVVPNHLFNSWGENRTRFIDLIFKDKK